ncbi:MAG: hypothetical protein K0R65_88 [Crocinitomicaceae bacterium]|nr:hypothetical protein [Crocinitomicaceae bacterium]
MKNLQTRLLQKIALPGKLFLLILAVLFSSVKIKSQRADARSVKGTYHAELSKPAPVYESLSADFHGKVSGMR